MGCNESEIDWEKKILGIYEYDHVSQVLIIVANSETESKETNNSPNKKGYSGICQKTQNSNVREKKKKRIFQSGRYSGKWWFTEAKIIASST